MQTERCPSMADGSPRECAHCPDEIAVGAPAARSQHNNFIHPECVDYTDHGYSNPARAGGKYPRPAHFPAPTARGPAAAHRAMRDSGDQVADAMGLPAPKGTQSDAALVNDEASRGRCVNYDTNDTLKLVCDAMGLPPAKRKS
jgi:hypothetical protein